MTLNERTITYQLLFDSLQKTNSRNDKEFLLNKFKEIYPELKEELTYILETLDGKHPIGWTFKPNNIAINNDISSDTTLVDLINLCIVCPKDHGSTKACENLIAQYGKFLAPIVNRTLRLGIGKSQLAKTITTPMLAKKYDGEWIHNTVTVTEKLDGNRCIAQYLDGRWHFTSRSGKPLAVAFDMTGLPEEFIYDGEIMSLEQTAASTVRNLAIINDKEMDYIYDSEYAQLLFNQTSGLVNSKDLNKGKLVYNIFDIISYLPYKQRRNYLHMIQKQLPENNHEIRILPVLYEGDDNDIITHLLYTITQAGGEGLMLNVNNRRYEHKRTDALLKYKQVQYMDMLVTDLFEGEGKYEGHCGGICCYMRMEDGREIATNVGSGLSDAQRYRWWHHREEIVGKIVQVAYHELTQDSLYRGTKIYSLRFPRLICVRNDKKETSEF